MLVKNKNIILTGASGVIGSVIAENLAKRNANLILLGRDTKKLKKTELSLKKYKTQTSSFSCDVLKLNELQQIKTTLKKEFSKIDALINVAGGATPGASTKAEFFDKNLGPESSFFGVNPNEFAYTTDLNFLGSVLPIKVFGEEMAMRQSGNIINISSMGAIQPLSKSPAYSAGKAAITNFTQWLAVHLSKVNVRVNAIAPGFILTEQNRFLLYDEQTGELTPRGKRIVDHTPMGRLGKPGELISTILWLLDDESSFITGITVPVDGGFSAYNGI